MFFTIQRSGSPYPLVAPIGVAAYCVVDDEEFNTKHKGTGRSRFGVYMLYMSDEEIDGYDTMQRAKKTWPKCNWQFVAVNPGMQHMHDAASNGELHAWYFVDENGAVKAEEEEVNRFLLPQTADQIQSTVVKGKLVVKAPSVSKIPA